MLVMIQQTFDQSFIGSNKRMNYPEVLLHEGAYYRVFKIQVDRKFYIYKKSIEPNPPAHIAESLKREFEIGQLLEHECISQYHAFFSENDIPTLVKEYIPGTSLSTFNLTKLNGQAFGLSLVRAVMYLHERGITHGDINPSNILVHEFTKSPFLIDFNLATNERQLPIGGGTIGYSHDSSNEVEFNQRKQADIYALIKSLHAIRISLPSSVRIKLDKIESDCIEKNEAVDLITLEEIFKPKKLLNLKRIGIYFFVLAFVFSLGLAMRYTFWQNADSIVRNENNVNPSYVQKEFDRIDQKDKLIPKKEQTAAIENENPDSIFAIKMGEAFLDTLRRVVQLKAIHSISEYTQMRNGAILSNHKVWQAFLEKKSIDSVKKKQLVNWYQFGYWRAFQESEKDLSKLNLSE
jgi:serine/threonine protein kinase